MSLLGKGVSGVFYGSLIGLILTLLKWIGKTYKSNRVLGQLNQTVTLVVVIILIMTCVAIAMEKKYANNQRNVTKFLTWLHGEDGRVAFVFCVIIAAVRGFMLEGPWERENWCFSWFIIVQVCFTALFATPEVSLDVYKILAIHQLAYTVEHAIKHEKMPAIACAVSFAVCCIAMFFRLAQLKHGRDTDAEESLAQLRGVTVVAKKEGLWVD